MNTCKSTFVQLQLLFIGLALCLDTVYSDSESYMDIMQGEAMANEWEKLLADQVHCM